ncbi:MAG: 5'/3'-nucleotidase SurE [Christensenellaceae bacterium]
MRILITNDDGIFARGIIELAKCLKKEHDVTVVAPDRERSASSHSLTMDLPLTVKKIDIAEYNGIEAYKVTGTPVDCVKIGLSNIMKEPVDLVLSGINHGGNIGTDIAYSGTVNAALDACMVGIPAIALSQIMSKHSEDLEELFRNTSEIFAELLKQIDLSELKEYIYNINFPETEAIKGLKVCAQGISKYDETFEKRIDPMGRGYYWISGELTKSVYNEENLTDAKYIHEGYITVSPLKWNITENIQLKNTKCKFEKMKLHF